MILEATTTLTPIVRLSSEQLAIATFVDTGKGNLIVKARAGTGKTFLIRQCLPLCRGTVGIAAFGKDIAAEIAQKVQADGNSADVGTFHSFGFRAIRRAYKDVKIEGKGAGAAGFYKFDVISEKLEIANHLKSFVQKAMNLAMQRGFGVVSPLNDAAKWLELVAHFDLENELGEDNIALQMHGREELVKTGCRLAAKAIKLSVNMAHEVISYSDMLYIPLVLNLSLPHFANLWVDEAQDNNTLRTEMAARMGDRLYFVGDDRQAIMGFTGADNDSLDQIARRFACTVFPMSETRRCGKAIVALAASLVPDYKANDGNLDGVVTHIEEKAFAGYNLVAGQDAIICRNTAPLVKVAYSLIARGVAAHVEGREIGKGLLAIVDRWKSIKTIVAMKDRLEAFRETEVAKLQGEKKDAQADALNDKLDTLLTIMETLPAKATVDTLRQDINDLFADTKDGQKSTVALMTAHKSKGREFRRVFGWGVEKYFPSKFAKQAWQQRQEANLLYVLYTRAIETLVLVDVAE